ncbi:MAG: GntR family transcriptional regulator [Hyphomicrobiaceae bacterium]|jgi:DNA-binding GntR family transcriptional regulator
MQFWQEAQVLGIPRKRVLRRHDASEFASPSAGAQTLYDHTAGRLRDLIVEGELAEGSRLVEAHLCRRFHVSRTPLREAFKVLAEEGLIELQPNRGATVARMTAREVRELFVVIAELESLAAATVCKNWRPEDFARLEAMHAEMLRCRATDNRHDYFSINDRIHRVIVALADNRVLALVHARLIARARRARYRALLTIGRWDQSISEHEALMGALRARKAAQAKRIWREHVRVTGELVAEQLARDAAGDGQT